MRANWRAAVGQVPLPWLRGRSRESRFPLGAMWSAPLITPGAAVGHVEELWREPRAPTHQAVEKQVVGGADTGAVDTGGVEIHLNIFAQ